METDRYRRIIRAFRHEFCKRRHQLIRFCRVKLSQKTKCHPILHAVPQCLKTTGRNWISVGISEHILPFAVLIRLRRLRIPAGIEVRPPVQESVKSKAQTEARNHPDCRKRRIRMQIRRRELRARADVIPHFLALRLFARLFDGIDPVELREPDVDGRQSVGCRIVVVCARNRPFDARCPCLHRLTDTRRLRQILLPPFVDAVGNRFFKPPFPNKMRPHFAPCLLLAHRISPDLRRAIVWPSHHSAHAALEQPLGKGVERLPVRRTARIVWINPTRSFIGDQVDFMQIDRIQPMVDEKIAVFLDQRKIPLRIAARIRKDIPLPEVDERRHRIFMRQLEAADVYLETDSRRCPALFLQIKAALVDSPRRTSRSFDFKPDCERIVPRSYERIRRLQPIGNDRTLMHEMAGAQNRRVQNAVEPDAEVGTLAIPGA